MTGCTVVTPLLVVVRKPTPPEINGAFCASAFDPQKDKSSMTRVHMVLETTDPCFNRIGNSRIVIERFTI
jgi:hypothetical protein